MSARVAFSKKKTRLEPEGRRCAHPGCNAILSIYNHGDQCQSHHAEGMGDSGPNRLGGGSWNTPTHRNGYGHL